MTQQAQMETRIDKLEKTETDCTCGFQGTVINDWEGR